MTFENYPLDKQSCSIEFESSKYLLNVFVITYLLTHYAITTHYDTHQGTLSDKYLVLQWLENDTIHIEDFHISGYTYQGFSLSNKTRASYNNKIGCFSQL